MKRPLLVGALLALILTGCYRADSNLTESGKGRPQVTASMPEEAAPGDLIEAVVNVSNPGPGDMESVVVAFSRIGDPDLPTPIVEVGTGGQSEGVEDVKPDPVVVSPDGVRFRFGALAEGEELEIVFTLVMPKANGEVGNAVTVYDGSEPERARGARLSSTL